MLFIQKERERDQKIGDKKKTIEKLKTHVVNINEEVAG
jgi:hypothetical protein